jgi:hypothetical protein
MKNLLNKLYRPIKSIDDKVLKWYSDKWEKHPKLTPALTFLSLATLQTALGMFIGDKLVGGVTVNPH